MNEKLAIDGGSPIREKPLPESYPGASVMGHEEIKSVVEVLERKSPYRYYGPDVAGKVKEFEKSFANKIGSKFSLAVTSGTAALITALKGAGIGPGDKVVIPANTFVATAGAVVMAGAVPVFADIDESMNIDPDAIHKVVDKYVKAIIPVHILGNPCEMDKIIEVAKRYSLRVIEDVAQSCGCKYRNKYAGSYGDIGCFSLQINKIITTGDGGALTTNNEKFYERAVRYHDQGMFREKEGFLATNAEDDIFIGQNYRMSEVAGAIASEQLKKLDFIIKNARKIKTLVKSQIQDIDGIKFRRINDCEGETGTTLFMTLPDKEIAAKFRSALTAENIPNGFLYGGRPVYMIPQIFYQKTADITGFPFNQFEEKVVYSEGMCPFAEEVLPKNIIISINPLYTEKDVEDIVNGIRKVARHLL